MYLTYEEYTAMGGTLSETEFDDYEFRAEAIINYATFNRLVNDAEISPKVKRLMKYIIDMVQKKSDALNLGKGDNDTQSGNTFITAQSNDGVSASYNGMASTDVFSLCDEEIQGAINTYLYGVMNEAGRYLLYRGLYKGE